MKKSTTTVIGSIGTVDLCCLGYLLIFLPALLPQLPLGCL
jgi:hypothetical protein